jgi:hypothetical protein
VIRARNLKLLSNYFQIYRDHIAYKADISFNKEGGCLVTFKGNVRNLMRGVYDDILASL